MKKNLRKRIYTSIALISLLTLSFFNNYVLSYVLLIFGIFSVLEFSKIILIILKKNYAKQLIINLSFAIYIFTFCSLFFIFSNYIHLKILIFVVLFTSIFSDIGGFVIGKIFKGVKLTKISPKKTVSGALGSVFFSSVFIFFIIFFLTNNFDFLMLLVGVSISISSQIGDLFFSYIKRKSSLKDTGNYLPGHGGILDRVDGILLGVPVGFLTILIFY